jgi:hypothetical protein
MSVLDDKVDIVPTYGINLLENLRDQTRLILNCSGHLPSPLAAVFIHLSISHRNLIEKYWVAQLSITCCYTGFEDIPNSGPIYLLEKIGSNNAVAFLIVDIST